MDTKRVAVLYNKRHEVEQYIPLLTGRVPHEWHKPVLPTISVADFDDKPIDANPTFARRVFKLSHVNGIAFIYTEI